MIEQILQTQYHAALEMLRRAVARCPADLWVDTSYRNPSWAIATHVAFYAHFYLSPTEGDFEPWEKARPEIYDMDKAVGSGADSPDKPIPYSQDEILEYLDFIDGVVDAIVPAQDLSAPSGFNWLPMNKLELQIYIIRHIQQHTGELSERLYVQKGIELEWVGQKSS